MSPDEDRVLRDSVPDRWKNCASPIGAVQSYIAELEAALRPLAEACLYEMGDSKYMNEPDEGSVYAGKPDGQGITFGMVRRAMATLDIN